MNFDSRTVGAPTREIAGRVATISHDEFPQRARKAARIALLDTDAIAGTTLSIERHTARAFVKLLTKKGG